MQKVLIATNIITLLLLGICLSRKESKRAIDPCAYPLENFDFHYKNDNEHPKIIILGNSLVRHAKWDSLLERNDILNRGISGDNIKCIEKRLVYLKGTSAKICFIEGGINDVLKIDPDSLILSYKKIFSFWREEGVIPVFTLVVYISPKAIEYYPYLKDHIEVNKKIKTLNDKLRSYANSKDVDLIDLNQYLCHERELVLKDNYTTDGIHLSESAYRIWADQIKSILLKYNSVLNDPD